MQHKRKVSFASSRSDPPVSRSVDGSPDSHDQSLPTLLNLVQDQESNIVKSPPRTTQSKLPPQLNHDHPHQNNRASTNLLELREAFKKDKKKKH